MSDNANPAASTSFWTQPISPGLLMCLGTGFSSGLPLFFVISLVNAWLAKNGVDVAQIGLLALAQLPYNLKVLWAPALDRYNLFLGRRRSWMLISQTLLLITMGAFGLLTPTMDFWIIFAASTVLCLFSATQDVAIDAFRREVLREDEQGLGSSIHVAAYRLAGFVPGALSLILADYLDWPTVFIITTLFMVPGLLMTLMVSEPEAPPNSPRTLRDAVVLPLQEFVQRKGPRSALLILLFMVLYKLGDSMATALATTFYIKLGFTMKQIGLISKNAGLWPALIGGIVGGVWMLRLGLNRSLWVFGFAQTITILGFAILAHEGPNPWLLGGVVGVEAFCTGLGTAAFLGYIAHNTNRAFTATQFALFTGLAALPRTVINSSAGFIVNHIGWFNFFCLCTLLAIPGMVLLWWIAPWHEKAETNNAGADQGSSA